MLYYKIPLTDACVDYPAGCLLCCAYPYNGYMYCKFERVTTVGSGWAEITESEFDVRCPDFQTPEYVGEIESTEYPGCYYRMVDGEKEWLNPPMVLDNTAAKKPVEYRTTERHFGKIVYVRRNTFTYIPTSANRTAEVSLYIPSGCEIIEISGAHMIISGSIRTAYPLPNGYGSDDFGRVRASNAALAGMYDYYNLWWTIPEDYEIDKTESHKITVTVKYVKP